GNPNRRLGASLTASVYIGKPPRIGIRDASGSQAGRGNEEGSIMQTLWQDLRYGARMLLKKRGFTVVAVITLGLGIGANTTMFSVINGFLLRPMPFKDPERLVHLDEHAPTAGVETTGGSVPDFSDLRAP